MAGKRLAQIVLFILYTTCAFAQADKKQYAAAVAPNNHFAVKFFKAAYQPESPKNVVTAPASLSYAFALLRNGASGPGRDELDEVFEFKGVDVAALNQANLRLHELRQPRVVKKDSRLPRGGEMGKADGHSFQPYRLSGAMWFPQSFPTLSFQTANREDYGFSLFRRAPTRAAIDGWLNGNQSSAAVKTSSAGKSNRDLDFAVATVLDFESRWLNPFDPKQTHSGEFKLMSGDKRPVQLMSRKAEFNYLRGDHFQAVSLDFYDSTMYIFLSDDDRGISQFADSLTDNNWEGWLKNFEKRDGLLELPKFEIHQRRDNRQILQRLGVQAAFSDYQTFVPMVGAAGAVLTNADEADFMRVDETGAKVRAEVFMGGVIGGICGNCPPPPPPFRMIVDHPFFFAIVDWRTDETLFMGAIVDPTEK